MDRFMLVVSALITTTNCHKYNLEYNHGKRSLSNSYYEPPNYGHIPLSSYGHQESYPQPQTGFTPILNPTSGIHDGFRPIYGHTPQFNQHYASGSSHLLGAGLNPNLLTSTLPATHSKHTVSTVNNHVPFAVPQPIPVTINRHIPVPVHVGVPVDVPRPVQVPVPQAVPVDIPRAVPIEIPRPVAVPIQQRIPVQINQPVGIPFPQPIPVNIPQPVAIPQQVAFQQTLPFNIQQIPVQQLGLGYGQGIGLGQGLELGLGLGLGQGQGLGLGQGLRIPINFGNIGGVSPNSISSLVPSILQALQGLQTNTINQQKLK